MRRTDDVLGDAPSFGDLLLQPAMVEALSAVGFVRPSPVQQAAIPVARLGADMIIQAKAGTGKTLVFAVAAVERVDLGSGLPQVLVLAPTREVALQAADVIHAVSPISSLTVATLIGGLPTAEDERVLRRTCHVVVGTPGRVLALLQRGTLVAQRLQMLVLDEADRLLGDAFHADITAVIEALPIRRQVLALSATYTAATLHDLRALMRQPQEVLLCEESLALLGVKQFYRMTAQPSSAAAVAGLGDAQACGRDPGYADKLASLLDVMNCISFHQAVVFCNHKSTAEGLAGDLQAAGQAAACLSSAKTQLERIDVVNALREFRLRALVSSDVAARGVDLDRVNLVVNFDLPSEAATYMHRVGRAGRFGTLGVAVSLLGGDEELAQLQAFLRDAAGAEVYSLPDHIPADWCNSLHSVPAQELLAAPLAAAAAAASAVPQLGGSAGVTTLAASGPVAASLWPEGRGPLPSTDRWPLRLADLNAAAGPGAANATKSWEPPPMEALPVAHSADQQEEEGIDVSYSVIPSPTGGHRTRLASADGHYAQLVRSAELDLRHSVVGAQGAANLLEAAFKWPTLELETPEAVAHDGTAAHAHSAFVAAAAPSAPGAAAGLEDATAAALQRRPLWSVQAQAHRRQLAQREEADALAAEAAYLEALAEAESEAEAGGGEEGEEEGEQGASDESAWRRYWLEHYNLHGYYPGARSAAAEAHPHAASVPPTPRARPAVLAPPSTSTSPPPPTPVEPPPLWASPGGAGSCDDGGSGYVRIPGALLQRYQELEWADWRRRYQEWCSAFDAWKLACLEK